MDVDPDALAEFNTAIIRTALATIDPRNVSIPGRPGDVLPAAGGGVPQASA
jgi:hypothetical protein